jgi:hypothetical protein
MRIYKLGAIALIPFFLAACPDADRDADPMVADDTLAADTPATDDTREHQVGDEETVTLGDLRDSGVTGNARFTVMSQNETEVMLEVEDGPANASMQAHIHRGTCDNPGEAVHDLEAVSTDADGRGVSTTTVNVRLANIMDGNHIIAAHAEDGQPVTCADIPEHNGMMGW